MICFFLIPQKPVFQRVLFPEKMLNTKATANSFICKWVQQKPLWKQKSFLNLEDFYDKLIIQHS